MNNSFGNHISITSFGESHGSFVGAVLDGIPANLFIDENFIQNELDRRKPNQNAWSTKRNEDDKFQIISGIFEGKTTGAPICILIQNNKQNSQDYEHLKNIYRPGHADFVYDKKYGNRDYRGGGRSSARVTAAWVACGAIAKLYLNSISEIKFESIISQIHHIKLENASQLDWSNIKNMVSCPDEKIALEMINCIEHAREKGDTVGGVISLKIKNVPIGIGEPLFNKLNARLSYSLFSINAVKGVEFGLGFESAKKYGSENNDNINTNNDGGITAGISNGKDILINIAFKPVSSIQINQEMLTKEGDLINSKIGGRHDACVLPRALPIVENMAALVLADLMK